MDRQAAGKGAGPRGGRGPDPRLTERRNPRTERIDRASPAEIVRLIQAEDRQVPEAVEAEAAAIAELIERVARRLRRGGRLLYVGAGTSGRLGVLDASECPPTFGTDPGLVRGIIAGGIEALTRSREGVEDDREAGRRDLLEAGVGPDDFVLGIATSGTTPYVWAALEAAAGVGAGTGFLSCAEPPERVRRLAEVTVTPLVGPEVIAGSTRMKAGTATKLVLNTLSTGVMIRLGKVHRNLMVDLRAVSLKLVDRSLRIVEETCEVDREAARGLLLASGGSVKTAIAMHRLPAGRAMAERLLDACDGFLGALLERFEGRTPLEYYAGYPPGPGEGPVEALRERVAAGPSRIEAALRRAEEAAADPGRTVRLPGGWGPSAHVAHLLEFEEEGVGPRVRAWAEGDDTRFPDWTPSDPPPRAAEGADRLLEDFRRARGRTVEGLPAPASDAWATPGAVGEERLTLHQFLRGVAQHDEAHAVRISERIHPALLDRDAVRAAGAAGPPA